MRCSALCRSAARASVGDVLHAVSRITIGLPPIPGPRRVADKVPKIQAGNLQSLRVLRYGDTMRYCPRSFDRNLMRDLHVGGCDRNIGSHFSMWRDAILAISMGLLYSDNHFIDRQNWRKMLGSCCPHGRPCTLGRPRLFSFKPHKQMGHPYSAERSPHCSEVIHESGIYLS